MIYQINNRCCWGFLWTLFAANIDVLAVWHRCPVFHAHRCSTLGHRFWGGFQPKCWDDLPVLKKETVPEMGIGCRHVPQLNTSDQRMCGSTSASYQKESKARVLTSELGLSKDPVYVIVHFSEWDAFFFMQSVFLRCLWPSALRMSIALE